MDVSSSFMWQKMNFGQISTPLCICLWNASPHTPCKPFQKLLNWRKTVKIAWLQLVFCFLGNLLITKKSFSHANKGNLQMSIIVTAFWDGLAPRIYYRWPFTGWAPLTTMAGCTVRRDTSTDLLYLQFDGFWWLGPVMCVVWRSSLWCPTVGAILTSGFTPLILSILQLTLWCLAHGNSPIMGRIFGAKPNQPKK